MIYVPDRSYFVLSHREYQNSLLTTVLWYTCSGYENGNATGRPGRHYYFLDREKPVTHEWLELITRMGDVTPCQYILLWSIGTRHRGEARGAEAHELTRKLFKIYANYDIGELDLNADLDGIRVMQAGRLLRFRYISKCGELIGESGEQVRQVRLGLETALDCQFSIHVVTPEEAAAGG